MSEPTHEKAPTEANSWAVATRQGFLRGLVCVAFVAGSSACGGAVAEPPVALNPSAGTGGEGGEGGGGGEGGEGGTTAPEWPRRCTNQETFLGSEVMAAWDDAAQTCLLDAASHGMGASDLTVPPLTIPLVTECVFEFPQRSLRQANGNLQVTEIGERTGVLVNCAVDISAPSADGTISESGTWTYDVLTRTVTLTGRVCEMAKAEGVRLDFYWGQGFNLC